MRVVDLRCQSLTNPFGINDSCPSLSWKIESEENDVVQTAYQILAAKSPDELDSNPIWDSGKVATNQSVWVEYEGPAIQMRERIYWKVKVWNGAQESEWSEVAYWEASLAVDDWKAKWIAGSLSGGARSYSPPPYFRKEFAAKEISKARLYVTSLGVYEAYLNGKRVGDHELAPGWTDYNVRVRYQTFDVTELISDGENAMGAIVGDGWYCGALAWRGRQLYGDRPKFLAQLEITKHDGTVETIVTDESWTYAYGPILESDSLYGESYDARKELGNWSETGYDAKGWNPVILFDEKVHLVTEQNHPIRVTQEIIPISFSSGKGPGWIFDLGQNIVGRARLKVRGKPGQTISLRFVEILDKDGRIYTENLRSAKQADHYTIKSTDVETWEPKFTFHGFRYVEVQGLSEEPTTETITGIVFHSDLDRTGDFECSDELINQLQKNIDWGWRGNSVDVPTDCPQRDERLGWTGDAQVFAETACFNRDALAFFEKYVQDMADSQKETGSIPAVTPDVGVVSEGGPAWADAFLMVPWTIYEWYGDKRILSRHYQAFGRFFKFLDETSKNNTRHYEDYTGFTGFGDWLSIDAPTSYELLGTAFFAHAADLMSRIATVLGNKDDAAKFKSRFEEIRQTFQDRYVTKHGLITSGSQTAYLLALRFNLIPDEIRPVAVSEIVSDVKRRGGKLSAGFVGSSYLNPELTKGGRIDVAYQLLNQKAWPSWLYAVTKGATTIWERWDGWTEEKGFQDAGMNSFNHYAYGAIGMWMYRTILGIQPVEPGFQKFRLAPQPGGGLTHAKGYLETAYGRIESSWTLNENGAFTWNLTIPPNSQAEVVVPGGETKTLGSGRYGFESTVS